MPIDPKQVRWDDTPDPKAVQWDAPKRGKPKAEPRPNAAKGFRSNLQFATPFGTLDTGIGLPEGASQFLAGVGKSFADTGRGIGQVFGRVSQSEVDEARRRDADLMDTGTGVAGNVGGQIAQMWLPGGLASKGATAVMRVAPRLAPYAAAASSGAAFGASQPVVSGESRAGNAGWSGAAGVAGQGVAQAAGRVARGLSDNPAIRQAADRARQLGVQLTPTQLLNNPVVNTISSSLNKLPFTGANKTAARQRADFNRSVSHTFGEDAPAINSQVYGDAKRRIGAEFERLSARNQLSLGPQVIDELGALEREAAQYAAPETANAVRAAINELLDLSQSGVVPGKAYQALQSKWGRLMKSGGTTAHYLGGVRDAVRKAMDDSISATDRRAWDAARQQYGNLKTVRDLVAKETDDGISPRALMGRVNATGAGKEATASGRGGRLAELAKLGQRISDPVPDSGTAQRLMSYSLLGGGGLATQSDNPWLSSAGYLTVAGVGGGRLLNSPRVGQYLAGGSPALQGIGRRIDQTGLPRVLPLPRTAAVMPAAMAADDQPLELDIVGGTPGEAITEEELEELRRLAAGVY